MPRPTACPSLDELRQLAGGSTLVTETEPLTRHVEQCEVCVQALQQLQSQDALLEVVRQAARHATLCPPVDDPSAQALMQRVGDWAALRNTAAATDETITTTGTEPEAAPASFDFLSPSDRPNCLGRLGTHHILRVLGTGGMGTVFLAEDEQLRRLVALKVLHAPLAANPTHRQRFLREAQAAAALDHEHIIRTYHVGEANGVPFLTTQYLQGETLEDRLRDTSQLSERQLGERQGVSPPSAVRERMANREEMTPRADALRLAEAEVIEISRQIAEGLAAAHVGGLIHRDVKPANVFLEHRRGERQGVSPPSDEKVTREAIGEDKSPGEGKSPRADALRLAEARGSVKLLDFGLARAVDEASGLTHHGTIVGTPQYMSPEQARGEAVDARSDLFSLGCVMYRMLTGQTPFGGTHTMATLMSLAEFQLRPLRELRADVSPELESLVTRLLAKNPDDRFASAREVIESLDQAGEPQGVSPRSPPVASQSRLFDETHSRTERDLGGLTPSRSPMRLLVRLPIRSMIRVGIALILLALFGGVIVIETNTGAVRVEAAGDDVEVSVEQSGRVVKVLGKKNQFEVSLRSGEYTLKLKSAKLNAKLDRDSITIKRGKKEVVRIETMPGERTLGEPQGVSPRSPEKNSAAIGEGKTPRADALRLADLSALDREMIPASERFEWQPQELVAVVGSHARRHWGAIYAAAATPDGKFFATGGADRHLRFWNAETGDEVAQIELGATVSAIQFQHDAREDIAERTSEPRRWRWAALAVSKLVFGDWDGVRRTVTKRLTLEVKSAMPSPCLAYSPDGTRLAVGNTTLDVWNVEHDSPSRVLTIKSSGPGISFHGVAFSADGETLLTWQTNEKSVGRWRVQDGVELPPLVTLARSINSFAGTPDGRRVVIAEAFRATHLWDVSRPEPKLIRTVDQPQSGDTVHPVAISADGNSVWTGGESGTPRLLVFNDSEVSSSLLANRGVFDAAVSPDGRRAFGGGTIGFADLHHASESGWQVIRPVQNSSWITKAQFTADGAGFWTTTHLSKMFRRDVTGGAFSTPRADIENTDAGTTVATTSDGEWFASANFNGLVQLHRQDRDGWRRIASVMTGAFNPGAVAIGPDHQTIAVGSTYNATVLLRLDGETLVDSARIAGPLPAAISSDNRILISYVLANFRDTFFDITVRPPRALPMPEGCGALISSTLSANGRSAYALKPSGELIELDLSRGDVRFARTLAEFPDAGYQKESLAIRPTPDGRRLFLFNNTGRSWWLDLAAEQPNAQPGERQGVSPPRKPSDDDKRDLNGNQRLGGLTPSRSPYGTRLAPAWQFPGQILNAEFTRDGRYLLLLNANGTAYVVRL